MSQESQVSRAIDGMMNYAIPYAMQNNQVMLNESFEQQRSIIPNTVSGDEEWPFFISHAWEDKQTFVEPLVSVLRANHNLDPWYDSLTLKVGDKLRQSIDQGIIKSKFGVVVLSPYYINKGWAEYELDGLIQIQNTTREKRILPIWHNISKDEVMKYSPSLANIIALKTSDMSTEEIAAQLASLL